jgi:hypothetical protein
LRQWCSMLNKFMEESRFVAYCNLEHLCQEITMAGSDNPFQGLTRGDGDVPTADLMIL